MKLLLRDLLRSAQNKWENPIINFAKVLQIVIMNLASENIVLSRALEKTKETTTKMNKASPIEPAGSNSSPVSPRGRSESSPSAITRLSSNAASQTGANSAQRALENTATHHL